MNDSETVSSNPALNEAVLSARICAEQRRSSEAADLYRKILSSQPDHAEALNYLGAYALSTNQVATAIDYLHRASMVPQPDAEGLCNLGLAYVTSNQMDKALVTLRRCVEMKPDFFRARLHLARVMELKGHNDEAITHYYAALLHAQQQGRWLNDASTAPGLRDIVKHATRVTRIQRKRLFEAALQPYYARHGWSEMARVTKALAGYLGEIPIDYPDARQRPKFFYFPDLPTVPYFSRELFPWYATLEENFEVIRTELLAVMNVENAFQPFLQFHPDQNIKESLGGCEKPQWNAFFFYRHGERYDDNCARCPRTAAVIDSLPTLARVRDHAPEVCFSLLTPGSHILPHRGVTNTRLVTHLPLIVPEDCALNVSGEQHAWQEGRCVTFDDTFEHEAWNRSERTRVVVLIDTWNPYMTPAECDAVKDLVETIGDFNRHAESVQI